MANCAAIRRLCGTCRFRIHGQTFRRAFVAQTRVGKFGREFEIYKFRRVGGWLRNWPLNDLPKLYNVLKGDLSLVGPRPAGPHEVALYTLADRRRLAVTPGLTGLWQIVGRNESDFSRQVELD